MDRKKAARRASSAAARTRKITEKIRARMAEYVDIAGATSADKRRTLGTRAKSILRGIGAGLLGALYTRAGLPFGVNIFGGALMCAAGRSAPYIYVGVCAAAIFSPEPLAYFIAYSLGMLMRVGMAMIPHDGERAALFCEKTSLRVISSLGTAFLLGIYRTAAGGFLYYDLFGCLLGMAAAPTATLVFRTATDKREAPSSLRNACIAVMTAMTVWSLDGLTLAGFSLSATAAFLITLYVARECGTLRAGVVGLLCGLAVGVTYAPLFGLAGLAAGLFFRISAAAATASALGIGIFYSAWSGGGAGVLAAAPDFVAASIVFLPLAHFDLLPKLPIYGSGKVSSSETASAEFERRTRAGASERFESMQSAFGALADVFRRMSARVGQPTGDDIHASCERIFDSYCGNCARHSQCWDLNCTDTCDAIDTAARKVRDNGRVLLSDLPDHTLRRCFRAESILRDINADHSARVERALKENKSEIFASDYEAVSRLIGEALRANADEFKTDERLSRRLAASAAYLDLPVRGITCYGTRKKTIVAGGVDIARVRTGADDIRRAFEKTCGFPLGVPEFSVERTGVSMTVRSARRYKVTCARAGKCRDGEDINGDSVIFFDNREDFYYALLSDGMGSGGEAAFTSRLCSVFLDKMLRAGNSKQSALDMLNDVVRNKGIECFATVDLFELDMITGEGCFVKSGAAPSYVIRGDSAFRIESGTYPIGIVREAQSEQISFMLQDGDVVVLLSDGVASDLDEALWVVDALTCGVKNGDDLDSICARVISGARARGRADDASCALLRVDKTA